MAASVMAEIYLADLPEVREHIDKLQAENDRLMAYQRRVMEALVEFDNSLIKESVDGQFVDVYVMTTGPYHRLLAAINS